MDILKDLQTHISSLKKGLDGNNPRESYVRDYMDCLIDSLNMTIRDLGNDKFLWSNLLVDKKGLTNFKVAPGVNISAYKIMYPEETAKHRGYWCWSEIDNRFYISINDRIFSGLCLNITDALYKFNEHANAKNISYKDTGLYVPPEVNPESRDVRTLSTRMHYVPSFSANDISGGSGREDDMYAFRVGSADNLKEDIVNCTPRDHRLFKDMTVSFMLALTVLGKTPTQA